MKHTQSDDDDILGMKTRGWSTFISSCETENEVTYDAFTGTMSAFCFSTTLATNVADIERIREQQSSSGRSINQ